VLSNFLQKQQRLALATIRPSVRSLGHFLKGKEKLSLTVASGFCLRSQRCYKQPDTALIKAKAHSDRELAVSQIRGVVGWV
jgi:hypothetical protein